MALVPSLILAAVLAQPSVEPLDFELFRAQVEPLFLKIREEGAGSCFACHSRIRSRFRLQPLPPGAQSWSEEGSRLNFDVVGTLVTPGEPLSSRLLVHPLAEEAGGDPVHTGGKFWQSQDDPEWQTLARWVLTGSSVATPVVSVAELDFENYRARVEPVFLKKRPGHARCYVCHKRSSNFRLEVLADGAISFSEKQSRKNFEATKRLVVPGKPFLSRLVTMALAEEAGGDPFHPGGKHWQSQDDPEWLVLANWVRGQ